MPLPLTELGATAGRHKGGIYPDYDVSTTTDQKAWQKVYDDGGGGQRERVKLAHDMIKSRKKKGANFKKEGGMLILLVMMIDGCEWFMSLT